MSDQFYVAGIKKKTKVKLAAPSFKDALPHVAREGRQVGLQRMTGDKFTLYRVIDAEVMHLEGPDGKAVLTKTQQKKIRDAIAAGGRWAGPIKKGEQLPQDWSATCRKKNADKRNTS